MKKLLTLVTLVAVTVVMGAPMAMASTTVSSSTYTTNAVVDGAMSLTVELRKNSSVGVVVTSMDFGKLVELSPTTGTLRSSPTSTTGTGSIVAMITANSHGLPYVISTKGSALTSGSNSLPAGACGVAPLYEPLDNKGAPKPTGATVGGATSWVSATDKVLYTSESGVAAMRTIQASYSITDDPVGGGSTGVPLNQAGGTYTGTLTISVTA